MAFTNTYDTTFPPETAAANQLGVFLRNFKTDIQERMSAISGPDTQRPAYSQDAQPANWNGRIYWATDTGNLYQFNNPGFTNIRSRFLTRQVITDQRQQNIFNPLQTIVSTISLPVLQPASRLRVSATVQVVAIAATQTLRQLDLLLNQNLMANIVCNSFPTSYQFGVKVTGGNMGLVNQQSWGSAVLGGGDNAFANIGLFNTAVNTVGVTAVQLVWTPQDPSDVLGFYGMSVEIF